MLFGNIVKRSNVWVRSQMGVMMGEKLQAKREFPQGISEFHIKANGWHRHANPAAMLALGLLLMLAFVGLFGGQPHPTQTVDAPSAKVILQLPQRIRNGQLFEMRMQIKAKQPFADLTLAISSSYWHDLTINTMMPAPTAEKSEVGRYIFSYGKAKAGDVLTIKVDGQINPPLFAGTEGEIQLRDGNSVIATIPVKMTVMP